MLNKEVLIKIRLYRTYLKGKLTSFDQNSNIILENVIEYFKDEKTGEMNEKETHNGSILLRGDSIISLSSVM
jgi:small nuclear ribonucleoprotein (snRNP)-like protein